MQQKFHSCVNTLAERLGVD